MKGVIYPIAFNFVVNISVQRLRRLTKDISMCII